VIFEGGTFNLVNTRPRCGKTLHSADIYAITPNHHLTFFTDSAHGEDLIPEAEHRDQQCAHLPHVRVLDPDGRLFYRLQSGSLPSLTRSITEDSHVPCDVRFSPFGIAVSAGSLVGERSRFVVLYPSLIPFLQVIIASTVLLIFAPQTAAPRIFGKTQAVSCDGGDTTLVTWSFNPCPCELQFVAEIGASASNPNTFGQAFDR